MSALPALRPPVAVSVRPPDMHDPPTFITLPQEILESTLVLLDPVDVASCAQTCRRLRATVYHSTGEFLWKGMFLSLFDDPRCRHRLEDVPDPFPWQAMLTERVHAREVIKGIARGRSLRRVRPLREVALKSYHDHHYDDQEQFQDAVGPLIDVLLDSAGTLSVADPLSSTSSNNLVFVRDLFSNARIREAVIGNPIKPGRPQRSARLHTYFGLTPEEQDHERLRGLAREKVYTMMYYSMSNYWGPFLNEQGRRKPDWVHLEAMMMVLSRDVADTKHRWTMVEADLPRADFETCRPYTMIPSSVKGDWAGVEGKWYRIVAFMDYNDLYEWNWSGKGPRTLNGAYEVVKLMKLDLKVLSIGAPPDDVPVPHAPDSDASSDTSDSSFHPSPSASTVDLDFDLDALETFVETLEHTVDPTHFELVQNLIQVHPDGFSMISPSDLDPNAKPTKYPTIWFTGTSSGQDLDPPVTRLRGRVDMGEDGNPMWRVTSRFSGHSWVSEGVQVGGVQSQCGVLAVWSELEHEEHGPAGPSWLWKSRMD